MSSPDESAHGDRASMDAISATLDSLLRRQEELDRRLTRMEAAVELPRPVSAAMSNASLTEPPPAPEAPALTGGPRPSPRPPPLPETLPWVSPDLAAARRETPLETRFGLGWLNRVAVVTLIFGVGFLFKYAVDSQWIRPSLRVSLGVAAGMLSLFFGEWIALRGQKMFARGLTGLGVALLYLSFYAGFGFYHLLPQGVAFLGMFLTTGAAAALALHYDSQAVALLGLAGGYLTPVLLSTGENQMWTLAGYTFILNLGALSMARVKRWTALEYLAWSATAVLFLGWASDWLDDETRLAAWAWVSLAFALFFIASVLGARLWLLALNTGAYFAGSFFLLDHHYHGSMGAFAFTLTLLHGLVAASVWRGNPLLAQITAAVAAVLLTLAIPLQFVGFRITMVWALEGAVLAWLAARFVQPRYQTGAWLVFALVFARLLAADAEIYSANYSYTLFANRRFLTFAVSAACLWIASRFARSHEAQAVSHGAGHLILLWGLGMEIAGWARRTTDAQEVSSVISTGISILMALYGAGLVIAGVALRSAVHRILGLGLLALVIAKLYLLDVWSLSRGFRITAFLALGGLLLLVSYLYSRFKPALERLWKSEAVPGDAAWQDRPAGDSPTV